jgi:membrane-bound lytic murein transglycosylase D
MSAVVTSLAMCSAAFANHGTSNDKSDGTPSDFWAWLAPQLKLSEFQHPDIDYWEARYRRRGAELEVILRQGGDFLYPLAVTVRDRGMPLELALLPIIESHLDPAAVSSQGARGLWQFIPSTAAHLGLKHDWWLDESADFARSTNVALDYLNYLHDRFGGWLLTLAAYNGGEGRVWRLMKEQRLLGKSSDFWALKVPSQTRAYVPKLLGLARVLRNPKGLNLPPIAKRRSFVNLNTRGPLDVVQIANMAGISVASVYKHNPQLLRWTTPPKGPHNIYLPIENSQRFRTALLSMPSTRIRRWNQVQIKSGDTLSEIAKRYDSSVATLRELNNLSSNVVQPGQMLVVVSTRDTLTAPTIAAAQRRSRISFLAKPVAAGYHKVETGESLWLIAHRYGTSINTLRQRNHLKPQASLVPGQLLKIGNADGRQRINYQVRPGDMLSRIAQHYEVSVHDIRSWNSLAGTMLYPGQTLELRLPGG